MFSVWSAGERLERLAPPFARFQIISTHDFGPSPESTLFGIAVDPYCYGETGRTPEPPPRQTIKGDKT